MDYTIKIAGAAGQGLQTVGELLGKVFSRSGYHVFTHQDYESRVRGGHNFYQIRVSTRPLHCSRQKADIVVSLDKEGLELHAGELTEGGILIYDSEALNVTQKGKEFLDVPFSKIAKEEGGGPVMSNTVATGAVLGMLGMGLETLEDLLKKTFAKKGDEIIEQNLKSARAGHAYAAGNCPSCAFKSKPAEGKGKMLINGVQGVAVGALLSGVKFYAAYPMTPSTGIMTYLASKAEAHGIVVEQAEDEIAAINMTIGASFAGVRAMTGTSGGGFALMVEGLSLAGMTETPIVIAEAQRPGPATGLPTRTEQGDLLFVLHAGHGEFPRVLFAPGTPEEAIRLTNKAFDLAEKYQIPAFVMYDQYLGDSEWTYDDIDTSGLAYNDYRLRAKEMGKLDEYKRFAVTESGISPLGVPGESEHLVVADSDEHDEDGHIIEDAETRNAMMDKRLFRKMKTLRDEIRPPVLYGNESPDVVLVGWGSMYGLMKEAVDILKGELNIAMLHFSEIYPFPGCEEFDFMDIIENADTSICVENNATGQFATLLKANTGYTFDALISRYDGRPFTLEELTEEINATIGNL